MYLHDKKWVRWGVLPAEATSGVCNSTPGDMLTECSQTETEATGDSISWGRTRQAPHKTGFFGGWPQVSPGFTASVWY